MDNLPVEIALEIFSRLSIEVVLECRRVCRTWRNLTGMHLRLTNHYHDRNQGVVSKVRLGLIFFVDSVNLCNPLYYGVFDDDNTNHNGQCVQNILRFRTSERYRLKSLIGSCNGLICLAKVHHRRDGSRLSDPIHIYNPITRERLRLQGYRENNDYHYVCRIYSGFGYSPLTNEYKVVRILYNDGLDRGEVQVYTLGGGNGWRNKRVTTCWLYEHGVLVNGAIHWLGRNGKDITVFNLSDENFHVLPAGPFSERTYRFTGILGSFGEWLCVCGCGIDGPAKCLDIWTFKKILPKKSIAATDTKDESWGWCKEFSIDLGIDLNISSAWHYRPLAITESFVLLKCKDKLFWYYPKTATMKSLGMWNSFEGIPHTNSLVSLKALGEKTSKKRKERPISLESFSY